MKVNGTFRKKRGFTTVMNTVARDKQLSFKAKGIYMTIQSFITMPDFTLTKDFLLKQCVEKDQAFETAWKELKLNGYLKVHMTPCNGSWSVEYDLLDERQDGAHTFYYSRDGKLTNTNLTRNINTPKSKTQHPPQKGGDANGEDGEGSNADGDNAEGDDANGGNNIKPLVKQNRNTSFCNTQSINPHDETDTIEEYKNIENMVKKNIEYDRLVETYGAAEIDEMVTLISDNLYSNQETIRIGRADYPSDIVKDRLMKLDSTHVEYVIDSMSKTSSDIKNIRGYTLTTLYNAPGSMKKHYAARVNHDLYGDTGY